MQELAALTPPLLVCIAFLAGIVFLVRREMAPKRRVREDVDEQPDISENKRYMDASASGDPEPSPREDSTEKAAPREDGPRRQH
jgi:hypothetical protein